MSSVICLLHINLLIDNLRGKEFRILPNSQLRHNREKCKYCILRNITGGCFLDSYIEALIANFGKAK